MSNPDASWHETHLFSKALTPLSPRHCPHNTPESSTKTKMDQYLPESASCLQTEFLFPSCCNYYMGSIRHYIMSLALFPRPVSHHLSTARDWKLGKGLGTKLMCHVTRDWKLGKGLGTKLTCHVTRDWKLGKGLGTKLTCHVTSNQVLFSSF